MADKAKLNEKVRGFWETGVCGTDPGLIGNLEKNSPEWFRAIEEKRYSLEPFIFSIAQFTRHRGRKLLEVGVGAGTDHLQWARAGAECHGVDLTEAAIQTTRLHLNLHGLESDLRRVDAEVLPFGDGTFDIVYSWGVIHHSEKPQRIIEEIRRVLKPGGSFIGMMYNRRSVTALKVWKENALMKGRPWRSLKDVIWNHVESTGTKAYTIGELRAMFSGFSSFSAKRIITPYDWSRFFYPLTFFDRFGWFIGIKAVK